MSHPMNKRVSNHKASDGAFGFAGALAVHALLIVGLISAMQWRTESETFYAELWAPQEATSEERGKDSVKPTPPEPEPKPEPKPEPNPEPKVEPKPPTPTPEEIAAKEAEIKLAEQRKLEEEKRIAEQKRIAEEKRRAEEKRIAEEKRRAEEKRLAEEKKRKAEAERKRRIEEARRREAERKKREAAEQKRLAEEIRKAELARIANAPAAQSARVGSTKGDPTTRQQNLTGRMSAQYSTRVAACIRPWITYTVPSNVTRGSHKAVYQLTLLPNGERAQAPKLLKSSGLPAFDTAVERAILKCNPLPKPGDHTPVPRTMEITFDPVEDTH